MNRATNIVPSVGAISEPIAPSTYSARPPHITGRRPNRSASRPAGNRPSDEPMKKNVIRPVTEVAPGSRSSAVRISGNAGSTLSIPSAVTAMHIDNTRMNAREPGTSGAAGVRVGARGEIGHCARLEAPQRTRNRGSADQLQRRGAMQHDGHGGVSHDLGRHAAEPQPIQTRFDRGCWRRSGMPSCGRRTRRSNAMGDRRGARRTRSRDRSWPESSGRSAPDRPISETSPPRRRSGSITSTSHGTAPNSIAHAAAIGTIFSPASEPSIGTT